MSLESQFDAEVENLDRQLNDGLITQQEFNKEYRELMRDLNAAVREEAQEAYDNVMDSH